MLIDYDEYQKVTRESSGCDDLPILALGLIGETVEFLSSYEGIESPGDQMSVVEAANRVMSEAGDVLWYAARIMDVIGLKFSLWQTNGTVDNFNKSCVKKNRRFRILENAAIVSEHVKKVFGHGHDLDTDLMHSALSDVIIDVSYILRIIHGKAAFHTTLEHNIIKLQGRYPDGFSTSRSINRSDQDR